MTEGERMLPCIDCPRLESSLQAMDYYRGEDSLGVAGNSFEAVWQRLKPESVLMVLQASLEYFEARAKEYGCDGPQEEDVDGIVVGESCPVQNKLTDQFLEKWGSGPQANQ